MALPAPKTGPEVDVPQEGVGGEGEVRPIPIDHIAYDNALLQVERETCAAALASYPTGEVLTADIRILLTFDDGVAFVRHVVGFPQIGGTRPERRGRSPRVVVALGEALSDESREVSDAAVRGLIDHHVKRGVWYDVPYVWAGTPKDLAEWWWGVNKVDMRRRASRK